MARVIQLQDPYASLSGSLSKDSRMCFRTVHGRTFLCRKPRPRTTPYSNAEVTNMSLFAEVSRQVTELLKDAKTREGLEALWRASGRKKCTLRSFVFSQLYKKTQEELERQNIRQNDGAEA